MRFEDEPAYVLEARPYRETSLLLEVLTAEHGRLAMVARGVRGSSRGAVARRAALEPFRRLRIAASGRGEVLALTTVESEGLPLRLAGAPLFSAWYVNELVHRLTGRGDPAATLFRRYADWLDELAGIVRIAPGMDPVAEGRSGSNITDSVQRSAGDTGMVAADADADADADARLAWSLRRFERDLIELLGYALVLDRDCETERPLVEGVAYCLDPEHGARPWTANGPWPRASVDALRAWAGQAMPPPDQLRQLKPLARALIRHYLGGGELRAWRLAVQWRA